MLTREQRKSRLSLALLFSVVVFIIIFISVVVASAAVYLLNHLGIITGVSAETDSPLAALLFVVLISNVVGFLLSLLLAKVPLEPIQRVIDRMNQLASGDFKARLEYGLPIREHPSFKELSDSFNTMARELESTELLRTDFINNFSHEFKTPIVSIAGFAKLLKRADLTPAQQREYLDIIEAESLRLSRMATNVLNLTKVEKQTILTETASFNLSEQLRTCILLFIDELERKNLELQAEFGECTIKANEALLKQVWINLVSNAVKFSPEYGTVIFEIRELRDCLQVTVSNAGEAIPAEKQERIFDKFYQCDESHATEGNGIGLAIVKKVVELHRGAVTVQSEHGLTVFTVTLPKDSSRFCS